LPRGAYLGERKFTFVTDIVGSRSILDFTFAGNLGFKFREVVRDDIGSISIEHELIMRLAARYDFQDKFSIPLHASMTWEGFTQLKDFLSDRNSGGSEFLFGAGYEVGQVQGYPLEVFAGTGFGVSPGYSIPDFRVFAGVAVRERSSDTDGDGIKDNVDQCPEVAEDLDGFEDVNGCPDPDNDQDGVPDAKDGAPLEPEDKDNFDDDDGVPDPDNDGDGLLDTDDKCADDPEDKDEFEDADGCPDPDNDADGVLDAADECINEAGSVENKGCPDPDRDGDTVADRYDNCPDVPGSVENNGCKVKQLVTIKGCKIDLSQKIYFESGKSDIRDISFGLMDNIMQVLKAQDQIKKIRIEGHTDSVGDAGYNQSLSQWRADAVKKYLVDKGIVVDRLTAVGLGEVAPIASNKTSRGRETNRRVEFLIEDCKEVQAEVEVDSTSEVKTSSDPKSNAKRLGEELKALEVKAPAGMEDLEADMEGATKSEDKAE